MEGRHEEENKLLSLPAGAVAAVAEEEVARLERLALLLAGAEDGRLEEEVRSGDPLAPLLLLLLVLTGVLGDGAVPPLPCAQSTCRCCCCCWFLAATGELGGDNTAALSASSEGGGFSP